MQYSLLLLLLAAYMHCLPPAHNAETQVNTIKAAVEVALARAKLQQAAYQQYREMAVFARQLDLPGLLPVYKDACGVGAAIAAAGAHARAAALQRCINARAMLSELLTCRPSPCVCAGDLAPTSEHSLLSAGTCPSMLPSPHPLGSSAADGACSRPGAVSLATFKQLLDRLLGHKADISALLPHSDVDRMRLSGAALKQALLPWPESRLAELHRLLPVLAAGASCWEAAGLLVRGCRACQRLRACVLLPDTAAPTAALHIACPLAELLHDFMREVSSAQSRLSALCTCVEDYVEKATFLSQLAAREAAMDAACAQVCAALLEASLPGACVSA